MVREHQNVSPLNYEVWSDKGERPFSKCRPSPHWLHFGAHEEEGLEATHDTFRKIGLEGVASNAEAW